MRRFLFLIAAMSVVAITSLDARGISWFSYDELFAKSDLVVIAEPAAKTRDTREHAILKEYSPVGLSIVGVVSDFTCLRVLKGARGRRFTLHHYRLGQLDPRYLLIDGPGYTTYEPTAVDQPYLMFLKREHDGRFAPAAGQTDPRISIQKIDKI